MYSVCISYELIVTAGHRIAAISLFLAYILLTPKQPYMLRSIMRAIVVHEAGGPSVLKLETTPTPTPSNGHIRIRVRSFGLNRSEMFTRQGYSPVKFPRVLGIEAAGEVDLAPDDSTGFRKGDVVVTAMGGMGRAFDGGYAEYVVVPASQVKRIDPVAIFGLGKPVQWDILGALPELMQTTWGSLKTGLRLEAGDNLLVRGGTSSVGLAAIALAKEKGASVTATTRNPARREMLERQGASDVIIDTGSIASKALEKLPSGFTKVLELVGVTTLEDSLHCTRSGGIVCMTGILGNKWAFTGSLEPMSLIPTGVYLTTYGGGSADLLETPIEDIAKDLVSGKINLPIKTFPMDQIVEAHRLMEEKGAGGKIVMLT